MLGSSFIIRLSISLIFVFILNDCLTVSESGRKVLNKEILKSSSLGRQSNIVSLMNLEIMSFL